MFFFEVSKIGVGVKTAVNSKFCAVLQDPKKQCGERLQTGSSEGISMTNTNREKCSGSKEQPGWSSRKVLVGLPSNWLFPYIRTDPLLRKSVSVIFLPLQQRCHQLYF